MRRNEIYFNRAQQSRARKDTTGQDRIGKYQGYVRSKNRSAERFIFLKSRGTNIRLWEKSRSTTERISALEHVTERSGFFECVTEQSGADIRLRGKSRIFTLRISTATNVTKYCGADIRRTVLFTERFISLRRANRVKPRHFPRVHRSNYS